MGSFIRLLPPKKEIRYVTPYSQIVASVLNTRFMSAQRLVCVFNLVLAVLQLPFLRFFAVFAGLTLASVAALLAFKVLLRPERRAHASVASEIYSKTTSPQLLAVFLSLSVPACTYFMWAVAPKLAPTTSAVKHFDGYTLEGVPEDWSLHSSFDMLVVNDAYLYGMSLSWGLALAFAVALIAEDAVVFQVTQAICSTSAFSRIRANGLKPAVRAVFVWATVCGVWPLVHFAVIRRHYMLFAPYIVRKAAQFTSKRLGEFHPFTSLVLLPVALLPLVLVWSFALDVFRSCVTPHPVSRGKLLSDRSSEKNSTLISGLESRADSTTALVAWNELLVISEHKKDRRSLVYSDVEGDTAAWQRIDMCVTQVIRDHISEFRPKEKNKKKEEEEKRRKKKEEEEQDQFAAGSDKPASSPAFTVHSTNKNIFSTKHRPEPLLNPNSALEKKIAKFAHSLESTSTTRAQRARAKLHGLYLRGLKTLEHLYEWVLSTYPGSIMRKTTVRTLETKLRHRQTTSFAVRSVARLITHSLSEDEYGYVQDTIAPFLAITNEFAEILEHIVANPPVDKTDVLVRQGVVTPDVSPAHAMLRQVNSAFCEVAQVFEPYFKNLNLNKQVLERAKRTDLEIAETAYLE